MNRAILGLLALGAACISRDRQADSSASSTRSEATAVSSTPRSPAAATNSVVPKDSVGLAAYEDAIIGRLLSERFVTQNGDTLQSLGSGFLQDSSAEAYSFRYYSKNGVRYLRVVRASYPTTGLPTHSTASRLRLPPIHSTEHLVMEGYCAMDGKDAPLVIAITGTAGDSVYRHARHAWKLDSSTGVFREIPTKGVMCRHVSGEE
jgi:hypothetical protein